MEKKMQNEKKLISVSIGLAFLAYFFANMFFANALSDLKLDITQERLYTMSEGTESVLSDLREPISLELFYTRALGEASPAYADYYARVKNLLSEYVAKSNGMLRLSIKNPEPFSEVEDEAVAAGLTGATLNQTGDTGYFGLIGSNRVDGRESIAFLALQREQFLEYDLTKLIHNLNTPEKQSIGILSSVPVMGGPQQGSMGMQQTEKWTIMQQLEEFLKVEELDQEKSEIPDSVRLLMVIQPQGLSENALYAIDQYMLKGGNTLLFVDPHIENLPQRRPDNPEMALRLLNTLGVNMDMDKVAADIDSASRVAVPTDRGQTVAEYVVWLGLESSRFDAETVMMANLEKINMASAGFFSKDVNATTTFLPLIQTGPRAMEMERSKVMFRPDVMKILEEYQPGGKPLALAGRISGEIKSAFRDSNLSQKEGFLSKSSESLNVMLVADVDMLADRMWVNVQDFFGQRMLLPVADNGKFLINAAENLSGSNALIGLRGRGKSQRPFSLVEQIQSNAEMQFRSKEQQLLSKLGELQEKIDKARGGESENSSETMLGEQEEQIIDEASRELLRVRKQLRDVQHELRKDIDSLDRQIKIVNIALVPMLVILGALYYPGHRKRRIKARSISYKEEVA